MVSQETVSDSLVEASHVRVDTFVSCIGYYHHQPINVPTAGAQTFLKD
jgi:hypothetical protein